MAVATTRKHTGLVLKLFSVTVLMFGFGYLLVPIYDVFCDLTGLNGKLESSAEQTQSFAVIADRSVTLEMVTALNEQRPLLFKAKKSKLKVHPGKYYTVEFYAENKTNRQLHVRAIPSVTPGLAAEYLEKTECFCFTEQVFEPHEQRVMPVRFVIKPDFPERYNTLTLAYTFFDLTETSVN